jgi:hypothetical protein
MGESHQNGRHYAGVGSDRSLFRCGKPGLFFALARPLVLLAWPCRMLTQIASVPVPAIHPAVAFLAVDGCIRLNLLDQRI